jgi:hypothetical protein
MNFISRFFSRKIVAPVVEQEPIKTGPVPEPLHSIPDGNFWGHHIEWHDFTERKIWGHYDNFNVIQRFVTGEEPRPPRMLAVGEVIRAKMQSDRYALFRVTEINWQNDPRDMFFGAVEDIGYEDEIRAAEAAE